MSGEPPPARWQHPIKSVFAWVLALLLAAAAFAGAVSNALVDVNPSIVSQIGIGNRGDANLTLTLIKVGTGKIKLTDPRVEKTAIDALAAWPANARALVLLAMRSTQAGDKAEALRYARLANRLSRRELGAQVVLLSDALGRRDLPGAVKLLDVSMRSAGERQRAVMYPVLAKGLQQPGFRRTVAPVIDQRREWAPSFFTFAVEEGEAVNEVADLYLAVRPATRQFLAPTLLARLISKLTDAGQVDRARRMYLATPGKQAATLADPAMTAATFDPQIGSLGWRLEDSPTISARQVQGDHTDQYAAMVDVGPGDASLALSRILFLAPGTYGFSAHEQRDGDQGDVASQWILRCNGTPDGAEIWRSGGAARITVPGQCRSQLIQLIVSQTDSANYGQLIVDDIKLTRGPSAAAAAPSTQRGKKGN